MLAVGFTSSCSKNKIEELRETGEARDMGRKPFCLPPELLNRLHVSRQAEPIKGVKISPPILPRSHHPSALMRLFFRQAHWRARPAPLDPTRPHLVMLREFVSDYS